MQARERLRDLAVSDSGFVFDPYSGATYSVNVSGLTILRGLKDGAGRQDIESALREQFEVREPADLQRDINDFVTLLKAQGLLPNELEL